MSKLKQMVMDQEQRFWEIAESTIFKSDSLNNFVEEMTEHFHLIRPRTDYEIHKKLANYSEGFNWEDKEN